MQGPLDLAQRKCPAGLPPLPGQSVSLGQREKFRWNHGQKEVRSKGLRGSLDRSEGERRAARRPVDQPEL